MGEFFYPSPLCLVQSFLQSVHYDLVHGFDLPISLRVGGGGISVNDSKLAAILPKVLIVELKPIVGNECTWGSEAGDDVLPDEFLGVHVSNVGQGFSFHPFSEVISSDYYVSLVPRSFGERSDNIKAPLCERPWAREGVENPSRLVDIRGESLALVTLLSVFLGLSLHVRPSVPLGECPVRQRPSSGVASTNSLM